MLTNATQDLRHLAVFTALGDDRLLLRRFAGREELSCLFQFQLEMLATHEPIDPARILNSNLTFLVDREDHGPRYFNGYVVDFAYAGQTEQSVTYRATVVPWLWFLTKTSDCRIFQNMTAPQIIEEIFRDQGFADFDLSGLSSDYAEREYCVQYRETDFNFVSRLMEEEGIYYFFRHENGKHTLVLADAVTSYFPIDDSELAFPPPYRTDDLDDQITRWEHQVEFRPGRWTQTDYDFKKPNTNLMRREPSDLPHQRNKDLEVYDYPGRFEQSTVGRFLTRIRMEQDEVPHNTVQAVATYRSLTAGGKFTVSDHRNADEVGKSYLLTAVEYEAGVSGTYVGGTADDVELTYVSRFTCIPDSVPFRPERRARRPVVEGPQTAVIVGPAGEEIYADEYARVKAQFHWDREGSYDENSSCWMRVSQEHAGQGWGAIDLPRIGEEVIVSFLEGDPDRPIIKGRVYNAEARPPFSLQGADNATNKTRRGGKTDTYKGSGYNEMTMDDTPGKEQLRVNAQHNLDANVNNNQTLAVGVDKTEDIGNNEELTVAVDSSAEVGNNKSTAVGNNQDVVVGNNIVIEAGTSITLACGASTIHMNQAGVITISGQLVTSTATASNSIVAPMTQIVGNSMLNQAGLICFDLGGVCHIKGKQAAVDAASVRVDGGKVVVKGAPIKLGEVGAPIVSVPPPVAGAASAAAGAGGGGGSGTGGGGAGTAAGGDEDTSPPVQGIEQRGQQKGDEPEEANDSGRQASLEEPGESDDALVNALNDEANTSPDTAQEPLRFTEDERRRIARIQSMNADERIEYYDRLQDRDRELDQMMADGKIHPDRYEYYKENLEREKSIFWQGTADGTVGEAHPEDTIGLVLGGAGLIKGGVKAGAKAVGRKLDDLAAKRADDVAGTARRGGAGPVRAGQTGERAVGLTGPKTPISVNGRTRVPDGLTRTTLTEVKNVKSQSYDRQLRDFADYARQNGLTYELYTRSNTELSGPLLEQIRSGNIIHKIIPGT